MTEKSDEAILEIHFLENENRILRKKINEIIALNHFPNDNSLDILKGETEQYIQINDGYDEEKEQINSLVRMSPDAVSLNDLDGNFVAANEEFLRLHNFSSFEELQSLRITNLDLFEVSDKQRAIQKLLKLAETGKITSTEFVLYKKNKEKFHAELSLSLILDLHGDPHYIMTITRDITRRVELLESLEEIVEENFAQIQDNTRQLEDEILEREEIESHLQENERKFRALFNASIDFIAILSVGGTVLEVNQTALDFFNTDAQSVIGYPIWKTPLCESSNSAKIEEFIRNVRKGDELRMDANFLHPDGKISVVDLKLRSLSNENNEIILLALDGRDKTKEHEAEAAKVASEARFKQLFDYSPIPFVSSRFSDGQILLANEKLSELLGYSVEELKTMSTKSLYKDTIDRTGLVKELEEVKYIKEKEVQLRRKDGTIIYVNLTLRLLEQEAEKTILASFYDITEKKAIELKLEKSREQLELSIEGANEGLWDWNIKTNEMDCSLRWKMMLGFDVKELTGGYSDFLRQLHPDDKDIVAQAMRDYINGLTENYEREFRMQRKDGSYAWINARGKVYFDSNREPYRMAGSHTDITKRKSAELALIENEKKFRTMFETAGDAMMLMENMVSIDCNPMALKKFGFDDKDELLQFHPSQLSPQYQPDGSLSSDKAKVMISEALEKGSTRFEWTHRRKDGTDFPAEVILTVYHLGEQNILQATIRDVSIQMAALSALKESEEKYKILVQNASEAIFILQDGMIRFFNTAALAAFGVRMDKLISTPFIEFVHQEDRSTVFRSSLKRLMHNQKSLSINNYRIINSKGEIVWVESHVVSVTWENGPATLNFMSDITEKKQAEDELNLYRLQLEDMIKERTTELEASETKIRTILETVIDAIITSDLKGVIKTCNKATSDIFGYSQENLIGQDLRIILPEPYNGAHEDFINKFRESGIKNALEGTQELLGKKKDGTFFPIEISLNEYTIDGQTFFTGIIRDISIRKEAEKEIRNLATVVRETDNIVIITGASGHIEWANNAFTKITGWGLEEVKGQKPGTFLQGEETNPHTIRYIKENIIKGKAVRTEILNYKKNNDKYWVDINIQPIYNDLGVIVKFVAVESNITERKKLIEELERAKSIAETSTQAKSEFLANMSHEIRTPMNAILGFADILSNKLVDKEHKKYLEIIQSSGNTLLSLINDILDISEIEAGKIELHPEYVNLKRLIEEMFNLFNQKTADKGVALNTNISSDLPDLVLIDEVRLRQVLINLIGNAVKFTEKGYIRISAKVHYSITNKNKVDIYLSVEDSGIGIAHDQIDKIFNPFEQANGQSTRKYGGTGLGLAIALKLITKMNGSLSVDSEFGHGSAFNILLSDMVFSEDKNIYEHLEEVHHKEIVFNAAKILVVDDVDTNIALVKGYLEGNHLQIVEAFSGASALEILSNETFDLILLDRRMPGMDGEEVARRIKSDPKIKNIPIVMLTASAFKEERHTMQNIVNSFLSKPVNKKDLISELAKYLKYTEKISADKKPETKSEQEQTLDFTTVSVPHEFVEELVEVHLETWKAISKTRPINSVKDFAAKLKLSALEFDVKPLIAYADDLAQAAQLLEIRSIKTLMNDFPSIIEKIQQTN